MRACKRHILATALLLGLAPWISAHALMAGAPPDSPAARVDPNTARSPWAGVGSITIGGNTYSGVLVAPDFVLTAAHVPGSTAPERITFNLNQDGDLSRQIGASAVFLHPDYRGFSIGHLANDIALIKLSQPVPPDVPIYGLYRAPLEPGSRLTLVGYGASGPGNVGVTVGASATVKRTGQNVVDFLNRGSVGPDDRAVYYFDFDGGPGSRNILGGPGLGNALETSLADGDSGSPAFLQDGAGHWLVAGINTFRFGAAPTFGNGGGGQSVASYAAWIDSVITPVPEPGTGALFGSGLVVSAMLAAKRRRDAPSTADGAAP